MKTNKKILSLLLLLTLVLSLLPAAAPAEAKRKIPTGTYDETVAFLSAVGIYSFADKSADETVTREMLAKMITDLLGIQDGGDASLYFTDVDDGCAYRGAVGMAAALGIMQGSGNALFAPKDAATYTQAIKAVVCALGYKPAADVTGGFSDGYMRCAYDLGLIKNAPYDYDAPLKFSTAATLIRLACEADVYEILYIKGKDVYFASEEGKTALVLYHRVYIGEGLVSDNGITALNGKTQIGTNEVKIGGKLLHNASDAACELLGCYAEYYRDADDNLLYVYKKENKVAEVKIAAQDILPDAADFKKTCLVTCENKKTRRYKISAAADLIYNGALDETFTENTLKIKDGTLRLLDTDSDGTYDIVIAEEYSDIVLATADTAAEILTARHAKKDYAVLRYGDYARAVFTDEAGKPLAPEKIAQGSVISVFKSKNKEKIRLVVSTATAEIAVDTLATDTSGEITLACGEKEYKLSSTYSALMKASPYVYKRPETDTVYTAYLNYEGNIAMLDESRGRLQYAYMIAAGTKNTGINASDVLLKLHLESDDTAVVPVAKKLTLNGTKNKSGADILTEAALFDSVTGAFKPQLVQIRIDGDGKLRELNIATDNTSGLYGFDLEHFSLDFVSESGYSPRSVNGIRTYNGAHIMDKNTKFFSVRTISKQVETADEAEVRVIDYRTASNRYGSCYVKMYDADEAWSCAAAVLSEPLDFTSRTFTVTETFMQLRPDGTYAQALNGYWAGDFRSFIESEGRDGIFSKAVTARYPAATDGKINKGDVFELIFDIDETIINARLIYSPARDKSPDYCFYDMNGATMIDDDTTNYILGYPCMVKSDRLGIYCKENTAYTTMLGKATPSEEVYWITILGDASNLSVMKYDCETGEVSAVTAADIPPAATQTANGYVDFNPDTKVFVKRVDGSAWDVLLVTNMYRNYN